MRVIVYAIAMCLITKFQSEKQTNKFSDKLEADALYS